MVTFFKIFLSLNIFVICGFSKSYYQFDLSSSVTLQELNDVLLVEFDSLGIKEKNKILSSFSSSILTTKDMGSKFTKVSLRKNSLHSFKPNKGIKKIYPMYQLSDGLEVAVTDQIVVKFKPSFPVDSIHQVIHKNNLKIYSAVKNRYRLVVNGSQDVFDLANQIMEQGVAEYCHPNFLIEKKQNSIIPNDEYFQQQWNFHNVGQTTLNGRSGTFDADIDAPEAWAITRGKNEIIVAVIDEGVTDNHPDLPSTRQVRVPGSNFSGGNPNDPSPILDDNHGNSCAGVIAASQNNSQGITGIAPQVKIMPFNIFGSATIADISDAIRLATTSGAHVISNSWGFNTSIPNLIPDIVTAITEARLLGRNGKGSMVVFAAGNTADLTVNYPGFVTFPANVEGVVTVGASNRNNLISSYSPISNQIDMVAPSHLAYPSQIFGEDFEIWSLDIPGISGYNPIYGFLPNQGINPLAYTGLFGGTSAACPQVAGVAALILSINPTLTELELKNVLFRSADKIGPYVYTNGKSNQTGFGKLNAHKAVSEQAWKVIFPVLAGGI